MNYYTSDLHFGHKNIIKYCNRPFKTTEEMDDHILEKFQHIREDDNLYILGDFAFHQNRKSMSKLFHSIPGKKHLILGNHDERIVKAMPWASMELMMEVMDGNKNRLTLCHYPMKTWNGARAGQFHLFGHVHDSWKGTRIAINVGVDVWDFYPVTLEDIKKRAETLPPPFEDWKVAEKSYLDTWVEN